MVDAFSKFQYLHQRRLHFRLSLVVLLFGRATWQFVRGYTDSPGPMQWIWEWPQMQPVLNWTQTLIPVCSEALGSVMLAQVLIWWLWKPAQSAKLRRGILVLIALVMGTSVSVYGLFLSQWAFPKGSIPFTSVFQRINVWILLASLISLGINYLALAGIRPLFPCQFVDISETDSVPRSAVSQPSWSIQGLLAATLVVALGTSQIVCSAVWVALMFSLYLWAFNQWQRAGYQLKFE